MEINEFMEVSSLFSYYKGLLSDKQKEYMTRYFEEDYSLSEIAQENDISRQAVYENVKRGVQTLKSYEEQLGFFNRDKMLKSELEKIAENFDKNRLMEILDVYF